MRNAAFGAPVYVKVRDELIQEVADVYDALDFLYEWPQKRRGTIYDTAVRACRRAHDGLAPMSLARNAFAGFAKSAGILEEVDGPLPWMVGDSSNRGGGLQA